MKVILTSKVKNLGDIGDIIKVSNGYAKNFLLPNKKVLFYSDSNYKLFQDKKNDFEASNLKNAEEAKKISEQIAGKNIIIVGNASDDGRLYGSVTTNSISNKINEIFNQKLVNRSNIILKKPIKDIGIYDIKVSLYSGIEADVKVIVARNESEVDNGANSSKEEITEI